MQTATVVGAAASSYSRLVVFNQTVVVVAALAVLVAIVVDKELAPPDHLSVLAGLAAGTLFAAFLEWRVPAKWKPRVWWIFPLWIVGVAAIGGVLLERVNRYAGIATLALAFAAFALFVRARAKEPGGDWVVRLAWLGSALAVELVIEELLGVTGAWWGIAIRVPLVIAFLYATLRLVLARRASRTEAAPA